MIEEFHNVAGKDGVKLLLRFADTKAQKLLKQQSNERRAYRAGEYNYSVEVVQGSTPSPATSRLGTGPISPLSFQSPMGPGSAWTPATTISPSYVGQHLHSIYQANNYLLCRIPVMKNTAFRRGMQSVGARSAPNSENVPPIERGRTSSTGAATAPDVVSPRKTMTTVTIAAHHTPTRKVLGNRKSSSVSPITSRKDIEKASPISARA